jgi:nucleoside-diphosphate-sugar epimerase
MKMISELLLIHNSKHFQRSIIFRPHNVYGPDMGYEHIIPEFAMKIKELVKKNAHQVDLHIQGTGKETRSFIFIEDFVNGLMVLMDKGNHNEIYNIGVDKEHSASEIAHLVGNYFKCSVNVIPGKLAEGSVSRRCPDMSKLTALGFNAKTDLETGILKTAEWYAKYGVIV